MTAKILVLKRKSDARPLCLAAVAFSDAAVADAGPSMAAAGGMCRQDFCSGIDDHPRPGTPSRRSNPQGAVKKFSNCEARRATHWHQMIFMFE
jgi:hypothetical protein